MSRNSRSDDSGLGCVMVLLLAIVAMPFVGSYLLLTAKEEGLFIGMLYILYEVVERKKYNSDNLIWFCGKAGRKCRG